VSGTATVADGVEFPDLTVALALERYDVIHGDLRRRHWSSREDPRA